MPAEPNQRGLGPHQRAAIEARAFRPLALARRGEVLSVTASIAAPSPRAVALAWIAIAVTIVVALQIIGAEVGWRELWGSPPSG